MSLQFIHHLRKGPVATVEPDGVVRLIHLATALNNLPEICHTVADSRQQLERMAREDAAQYIEYCLLYEQEKALA